MRKLELLLSKIFLIIIAIFIIVNSVLSKNYLMDINFWFAIAVILFTFVIPKEG